MKDVNRILDKLEKELNAGQEDKELTIKIVSNYPPEDKKQKYTKEILKNNGKKVYAWEWRKIKIKGQI